jgi:transcriptional regulator with XRE-family HTH domain
MTAQEAREGLGRMVREKRKEQGLSQAELAQRAGLNRPYVSDVERGTRNVSLDSICKLANALGMTLAELFSGWAETTKAPEGEKADAV